MIQCKEIDENRTDFVLSDQVVCKPGYNQLQYAIVTNRLDSMNYILGHSEKIQWNSDANPTSIYELGARVLDAETFTQLVHRAGYPIDKEGKFGSTVLSDMVTRNKVDFVELTLDLGADPYHFSDRAHITPLEWAVMEQEIRLLNIFTDRGYDLEKTLFYNNRTYVHYLATTEGADEQIAQEQVRAFVNAKDSYNSCPLNEAAEAGLESNYRALRQQGATAFCLDQRWERIDCRKPDILELKKVIPEQTLALVGQDVAKGLVTLVACDSKISVQGRP